MAFHSASLANVPAWNSGRQWQGLFAYAEQAGRQPQPSLFLKIGMRDLWKGCLGKAFTVLPAQASLQGHQALSRCLHRQCLRRHQSTDRLPWEWGSQHFLGRWDGEVRMVHQSLYWETELTSLPSYCWAWTFVCLCVWLYQSLWGNQECKLCFKINSRDRHVKRGV